MVFSRSFSHLIFLSPSNYSSFEPFMWGFIVDHDIVIDGGVGGLSPTLTTIVLLTSKREQKSCCQHHTD